MLFVSGARLVSLQSASLSKPFYLYYKASYHTIAAVIICIIAPLNCLSSAQKTSSFVLFEYAHICCAAHGKPHAKEAKCLLPGHLLPVLFICNISTSQHMKYEWDRDDLEPQKKQRPGRAGWFSGALWRHSATYLWRLEKFWTLIAWCSEFEFRSAAE